MVSTVLRTGCVATLSLLLLQTTAQADPIEITSGSLTGHVLLSAASLDVVGDGFSFMGYFEGGFLSNLAACTPCASSSVNLGASIAPDSTGGGAGTIKGVDYPWVYIGFSSGTFTTPTAMLTDLGASMVEVPFEFSAVMNGYLESPVTRPSDAPPNFTVNLTGRGRASASFFGLVDDTGVRSYSVHPDSVRYEFT